MDLKYDPNLSNNIRSIKITVNEFGSRTLTPEEELEILDNYRPYIQYKDIDFTGSYKTEGNKVVKATDKVTYGYNLSIEVPTVYVNNGNGTLTVTVGNEAITIITSEVSGSPEERNDVLAGVLDYIKADTKVSDIFKNVALNGEKIEDNFTSEENIELSEIETTYGKVVSETETTSVEGDLVTLGIRNKVLEINKDFEAEFIIATKDVKDDQVNGNKYLITKDLVGAAMIALFKDKITEVVEAKVLECKEINDETFEEETTSDEF